MAEDIIPKSPHEVIPTGPLSYARFQEERGSWDLIRNHLFFVIFKWKRLILSLFLVFAVAAGVALYFKPPVSRATAKLLFKADRIPLKISGFGGGKVSQPTEVMKSEVELLRSREVLLPVAEKLLSGNRKPGKKVAARRIEALRIKLARKTIAQPLPDTNIIKVSYEARTPDQAKRTLGLIIDQYLEKQAAIQSGSTKLLKFYGEARDRVAAELREAEEALKNWQEATNVVSIDNEINSTLATRTAHVRALQKIETDTEVTRAKIAALKSNLSTLPELIVMSREQVRNPLVSRLKSNLITAQVGLQDLLQRYTDKDRRVREKKNQIALFKKQLADAEKEKITGKTITALNPLRRSQSSALTTAQILLSSLASQKESLTKQTRKIRAALDSMLENKVDMARLSRAVDHRKDTVALYAKKLEEARIASGLGNEQLAKIAVIEHPNATLRTSLGRQILMAVLSAFVGLGLGLAIAFGFEFFNNSIRTQSDIEHYLGYPMLAALPDLRGRPLALEE